MNTVDALVKAALNAAGRPTTFENFERVKAALTPHLASEPELRAKIVSLQAEVERLTADRATVARIWKSLGIKTYEEAGGREISEIVADLTSRVEALSAEVGKLTEALEPFSVIAGEYFAQNLNRDDIVASIKRPDGTRLDITAGHLFDARAALDKGATR